MKCAGHYGRRMNRKHGHHSGAERFPLTIQTVVSKRSSPLNASLGSLKNNVMAPDGFCLDTCARLVAVTKMINMKRTWSAMATAMALLALPLLSASTAVREGEWREYAGDA